MDDLISRQAAIDVIGEVHPLDYNAQAIKSRIESLPSAQPEIIHCKDCKWWDKQDLFLQGRCALLGIRPTGGWFCANADMRKEQNETN